MARARCSADKMLPYSVDSIAQEFASRKNSESVARSNELSRLTVTDCTLVSALRRIATLERRLGVMPGGLWRAA